MKILRAGIYVRSLAFLAPGGERLGAVKETRLLLSLTSLPGPSLASPPLTRSFLSSPRSHLSHRDSSRLFTHSNTGSRVRAIISGPHTWEETNMKNIFSEFFCQICIRYLKMSYTLWPQKFTSIIIAIYTFILRKYRFNLSFPN